MRTDFEYTSYSLSAYILMPDLVMDRIQECGASVHQVQIIKSNSHAALKELDFWMRYGEHKTPYTMTYSNGTQIQWTAPFDHVTLLSGTNAEGHLFSDSYKLVQRIIAQTLLHDMAAEPANSDDFSYSHFQHNLCAQHPMHAPVHPYRAVGAYSKRIPRKKLLSYEACMKDSSNSIFAKSLHLVCSDASQTDPIRSWRLLPDPASP